MFQYTWMDVDDATKYRNNTDLIRTQNFDKATAHAFVVPSFHMISSDALNHYHVQETTQVAPLLHSISRTHDPHDSVLKAAGGHQAEQFRRVDHQVLVVACAASPNEYSMHQPSKMTQMTHRDVHFTKHEQEAGLPKQPWREVVFPNTPPRFSAEEDMPSEATIVQPCQEEEEDNTIVADMPLNKLVHQDHFSEDLSCTRVQEEEGKGHHHFNPSALTNACFFTPLQHEMEQWRMQFLHQRSMKSDDLKHQQHQFGQIRMNGPCGKSLLSYSCSPGKRKIGLEKSLRNLKCERSEMLSNGQDSTQMDQKIDACQQELRRFSMAQKQFRERSLLLLHESKSPFHSLPILQNRYIFMELLGKGGSAEVWKVLDYLTQQVHALKISFVASMSSMEFQKHSNLEHERIVRITHDTIICFEHAGKKYQGILMEHMETDLKKVLEEQPMGFLDEGNARMILQQLLDGVIYMHDHVEIAHFDLKPGNILLNSSSGELKLTDFHLARSKHLPFTLAEEGTLKYLPPEYFQRRDAAIAGSNYEKVDIWAIGIIFFQMLFGEHPLFCCSDPSSNGIINNAASGLQRFQKRMVEYYHSSSSSMSTTLPTTTSSHLYFPRRPDVSDQAKTLISFCLASNPKERPTAHQLRFSSYFAS